MVQQRGDGGPGGRGPINVSVERADVARAQVTRMTMDDQAQGAQEALLKDIGKRLTGGTDSLQGSLTDIKKAIDACCVAGGGGGGGPRQKADAQAADTTDKLTETIQTLQKSMEVLISATQQLSVSGGEASSNIEDAGGLALAQQKAQAQQFEALSNMMFKFEKVTDESAEGGSKLVLRFGNLEEEAQNLEGGLKTIRQSLREVRMAEYVKFLNQSTQGLENFVSNLTDLTTKMREAINQFKQDMDTARGGLITTFDLFTSEVQNIARLFGGELADSTRMVIEAIQRAGPEGAVGLVFGRSMEEQGALLHDIRSEIIDSRLRSMFGFEGVTDNIIEQLDVARQVGLRGQKAELYAEKRAREELNLMANIQQNTGMTAEAVRDQVKKVRSDVRALLEGGAVNRQQAELLTKLLNSNIGQTEFGKKMLMQMVESDFRITGMDQEMIQQLQMLGLLDDYLTITKMAEEGRASDATKLVGAFNKLGVDMQTRARAENVELLQEFGLSRSVMGEQVMALKGMMNVNENTGKDTGVIRSLLDTINEYIKKYFPTALAGLAVAMIAHTSAMIAHTLALWQASGGLRGMMDLFRRKGPGGRPGGPPGPRGQRGWMGGTPRPGPWTTTPGAGGGAVRAGVGSRAMGLLKGGGRLAGGFVRGAAPVVTGGMIAKDVYDVATGEVTGENVGALGGAAIGAVAGGIIGSVVPVVGTALGAWVGAGLGNWLGEMAGEKWDERKAAEQAAARAQGVAIGPQIAGPSSPEIGQLIERGMADSQMTLAEQTSLLQQMADSLNQITRSNQMTADGILGMKNIVPTTATTGIQVVGK